MADDKKPEPDDGKGDTKTLTQAEVDKIVDERLKRERAKFADYADLKAKAEAADKAAEATKSDMDKLTEQVSTLTDNLSKSELARVRAEVISDKKLTTAQVKYLKGATREELDAAADELLADMPAPPPAKGEGGEDDGKGAGGEGEKPGVKPNDIQGNGEAGGDKGEINPSKLADAIPRP